MIEVFGVPTRLSIAISPSQARQDTIQKLDSASLRIAALLDSMKRVRSMDTTVRSKLSDSTMARMDSLHMQSVIGADSIIKHDSTSIIKGKSNSLEAPVFGKNEDSLVYDVAKKQIYIYGKGDVQYQNMGIKADYLNLDTEKKLVHARGITVKASQAGSSSGSGRPSGMGGKAAPKYSPDDTSAVAYNRPIFKEGDTEYEVDSIDYNMDSQKAYIKGVNTKEGEGFLYGGEIKKMKDNVIHMHNGRYTTCDAECPHFYMRMGKATVVPGKKTVFGPAYMVFEDVPLYFLGLPFGFFPQVTDRNSGFIIPEIGEEVVKGFFLRNGGYYFVVNDNIDLKLTAGIYTLGSWQASASSNYMKRYKFAGSFAFNYASDVIGEEGASDYVNTKNMQIQWSHRQDAKASPGSTFSASVNFSTSSYNKYNPQNLNDYLNTQTNSSISYQKSWAGTPFSLSVNGQLSQEMRDTVYSFNIPNINFNVNRINPFKRKKAVGAERWYEKISFTYNFEFRNNTGRVKEKDLFKQKMFDGMQFGAKHSIPVSASFNLLQYLSITPSLNYNERWYFRQINQGWSDAQQKIVITDTTGGFNRVYDYGASLGFTTNLYGMYTMGSKKPVFIRHVMTPRFNLSYNPGFNQFYRTVQTNDPLKPYTYSPFSGEMYGVPSQNTSASIGFGIENSLEAKIPSDQDTTGYRKIKIIEALSISSSYNFMADSLGLSPFAVSLRTTLFKGVSINVQAQFDPYQVNEAGQRINKFVVNGGKGLARLTSASTSFGYSFSSKSSSNNSNQPAVNNQTNNGGGQTLVNDPMQNQQNDFFNQNQNQPSQVDRARMAATQYYDFDIPWSFGFNYSWSYSKPANVSSLMQTINFNGSANITSKWALSFSAGYDIMMKKLTPGAIQITRDLHCWQMSFSWIPVGFHQSWQFTIRAKSSMLSDLLKWEKNNSFFDNQFGY